MLSGKYECYSCGEVFEGHEELRVHEREDHVSRTDRVSLTE